MSAKTGGRTSAVLPTKEVIVNFDPVRVAAPFYLRCAALLLDYIVVLLAPVLLMLLGRYMGTDGTRLVAGNLNDTGWLIALVVAGSNFVLLPLASGRSLGKIATGLRIVRRDGREANIRNILMRNVLGYLLTAATLGLGYLLSAFTRTGRALHDLVGGTVVIYAEKRLK